MGERTYHGTYPIRSLGKGEMGVHMPISLTGYWDIYENEDGTITMKKAGDKKKVSG
jgi:hypothetical protein